MEKYILVSYSDALARVKYLRKSIRDLEAKLERMEEPGYYVTDTVTKGRKGKKSLGNVTVSGFPRQSYNHTRHMLAIRKKQMEKEEQKLLELTNEAEEYISSIGNIEIRNILSLYYIEDLNWVQVAHRMNEMYGGKEYTESSCRQKHERFLKKI